MKGNKAAAWRKARPLIGCLLTAVILIGLAGAGATCWFSPRVNVADAERLICSFLPPGTSKKDVVAWLVARSMTVGDYKNAGRGSRIESWIPDSGTRFPFDIKDIRIEFFFDENNCLIRCTVQEEDRF